MATREFDSGQCLERVRQHDPDAAAALVEGLYPLVIRIVRNHWAKQSDEEDLAQEIFLKLFSRLDQYEARAGIPLEHWVSRLAVRTCLDALRAKGRRPEVRIGDLPEEQQAWLDYLAADESAPPDSAAGSARELVGKLLAKLSPEDRLVITLLDLEEKSVKEISELTGWGQSLVKVRAFRARRKLRKLAQAFK
ncbi:MAG: sigma-70 family RNA polymerase sigma factor [Verrucomicrobia bacterium]|nr:sigma-70 family RNA polymerase sigma factor [Verrucomicrobiota bacterium]